MYGSGRAPEVADGAPRTIFEAVAATPDVIALVDAESQRSWRETAEDIARRANALMAVPGLGDGPVAVMGENSAETMLFYGAAAMAGIGAILVNWHLSSSEVRYLLEDGGAGAIWATDAYLPVAREAAETAGVTLLTQAPDGPWRQAVAAAHASLPAADRPMMPNLIYTSGTTGFPKGVAVPREPLASVCERIEQASAHHFWGLGAHLVAGPLYHSGPHGAVGLLLTGTTVVVPGRFDPAVFLEAVERYSIATSGMVPTHFVRLLSLPAERRAEADLSSLKMVTHTGSGCPESVKRAMIDWLGPILRENYGGSESGIISHIDSPEWLARPGSVGRLRPRFQAVVVGDGGKRCGSGEDGQLYFRDEKGLGIRYHNAAEKTAAAHLEPGVFTLGDVGHVDDEGYLYITGRNTDMVISGGVNIYPAECESLLMSHRAVDDVALFGIPDEEMVERLVGIVALTDGTVGEAALLDYARERIAHYKVPKELRVVAEVPRNPMGKLNKRELARRYLAAEL